MPQKGRHSEQSEGSKILEIDSSVTAFPQNDVQVGRHCEKGVARRSNPLLALQGNPGLPRSLSLPAQGIQTHKTHYARLFALYCNDGDGMICEATRINPHPTPLPRRGNKRRVAFTLAEVLITLGIIGVVAAMTIPTLMTNHYEKRTIAQLKATQSILSQAFRSIQEEHGTPGDWELTEEEESIILAAEKLKNALKVTVDCGCNDSEFRCAPNVPYQLLKGGYNNNNTTPQGLKGYYTMVLSNGTLLYIRTSDKEKEALTIQVDTNGKAAPNTLGRDMFQFKVTSSGAVYPAGSPAISSNESYLNSCNLNGTGFACTYYILKNGNMNYLHKK